MSVRLPTHELGMVQYVNAFHLHLQIPCLHLYRSRRPCWISSLHHCQHLQLSTKWERPLVNSIEQPHLHDSESLINASNFEMLTYSLSISAIRLKLCQCMSYSYSHKKASSPWSLALAKSFGFMTEQCLMMDSICSDTQY